MTKRVAVLMGCDLEAGAEVADVVTVTYTIDGGSSYELELCPEHRKFLEGMTGYARKVETAKRKSGSIRADRDERARIRAWALEAGYQVGKNGRVPERIVEAYRKRNGNGVAADPS